jgi:hypothetical protein
MLRLAAAKALDQRDGAAIAFIGLELGGVQQMARDHALYHLQHRADQLGLDEMARAARVGDEPRPRQVPHQQADAAGVVEVHVRRDDEVDRVRCEPGRFECGEQARHCVVGAGVDEGGAPVLDDEEGGVEARPVKARVDDLDAVRQPRDEVRRGEREGPGEHRGDSRERERERVCARRIRIQEGREPGGGGGVRR